MMPTPGRIVHYFSHGSPNGKYKSEKRPAIVIGVTPNADGSPGDGSRLMLFVITPNGSFHDLDVPASADAAPGSWMWPARD